MILHLVFPHWFVPNGLFNAFRGMMTGFPFSTLIVLAFIVFWLCMLIDCLKRDNNNFAHPISPQGRWDKLIWALAIALTMNYFCLGAIIYFFVVKKALRQTF